MDATHQKGRKYAKHYAEACAVQCVADVQSVANYILGNADIAVLSDDILCNVCRLCVDRYKASPQYLQVLNSDKCSLQDVFYIFDISSYPNIFACDTYSLAKTTMY